MTAKAMTLGVAVLFSTLATAALSAPGSLETVTSSTVSLDDVTIQPTPEGASPMIGAWGCAAWEDKLPTVLVVSKVDDQGRPVFDATLSRVGK